MPAITPRIIATNERQEPLQRLAIQCVDRRTQRVLMTATTGTDGVATFSAINDEREFWFRPESNRNEAADGNYGQVRIARLPQGDSDTVAPVSAQDDAGEEDVEVAYLVFTTAPKGVDANVETGAITVQRRNTLDEALTEAALVVYLYSTSSGGVFKYPYTGGAAVTSVTIADGDSTVSFSYTDTTAGNPVLTASTEVLT